MEPLPMQPPEALWMVYASPEHRMFASSFAEAKDIAQRMTANYPDKIWMIFEARCYYGPAIKIERAA